MYRIIDNRCSGKTSRLMLLAKDTNSIVACSNPRAMQDKAYSYGITGISFVNYDYILNKNNVDLRGKNIMIDELENFVQYQLSANLQGYTLSNED
jgi:hypothetical protein